MYRIITKVNSPEDLRELSYEDLRRLSKEIRNFLLESVSKTGGHLASNLGIVELTLALHRVFNSPNDKIIWDVGHQAYVHKIITGRKDKFHTLRQFKGLSGFPKCKESVHDCFETGHSSTSISAGLGMALARDLKGEKYSVLSIIGDGALTGGMAFEALNHAGHSETDFIVILNDNEMSISENVGGLSKYLNRLRTDPTYFKMKDDVEQILSKIPAIGKSVVKTAQKAKETIKYFFVPGVLFEELGFTYIGPVNGHDIKELTDVFKRAKKMKGPILIHTITKKGKGYRFAERYPDKFHGIGPFALETGKKIEKTEGQTYSNIFGDTLLELAEENSDIVAITAAMPSGTGLSKFAEKYPERFFDVGIAEQHGVTFAAGLASNGLRPVFAVYSTFLQRGYDQVLHDVCLQNLPVVLCIDRAGIVGHDGETHHGVFDLSFLSNIPNIKIAVPKDGKELRSMMKYAFSQKSPIAIRYPRGISKDLTTENNIDDIYDERAEVISIGKDACIIAVGKMVARAIEVSKLLKKDGIETTVINARFVKPLDKDTILSSIKDINNIFTMEDNVKIGGFGSQILNMLSSNEIGSKNVKVFAFPDKFIEHGETETLFKNYNLDTEGIYKQIISYLK
ncbi:1-deoxy-D-xylulose-5-phosphate synthase [Paramaledivibacter caminithermalis]|uniref:1-deoxy-D-xylulose-5-phosphate synthase n=1 Tax=Paramaledivibacter caminithermalis (strain DSM 15212 / CIP 107654 / DViRD3) TaxID=1121301 RepID=A0A1M6JQC9_PARC5|nr:1-deoxy-D-xylulose-5-phosphate synthase [Paramaledivibacter caminithermalis]SHJ48846.1 1-deoxy-D-xylulose-5-phosphate synthase [Paramaledivibacter caminithermalis DSM 15212]